MKSKITIEVNFEEGNMPVIQVIQRQSEDVRDNLIQSFLQSLAHTSRWGKIIYMGTYGYQEHGEPPAHRYHIVPLKPSELEAEIKLMEAVVIENYPKEG